ncbi:hypothetical protein CCUS01_06770 [Colletotrichum cuscutae]|uniref:Uncharacterized protein n=1 Tax=Colletotrichum cuscutae TaxID=1209917 RepID=A0AAI9V042_9PEZI|nr:hypothetical protein CCUS01_06770 [Colletotrichum cuscutae]
MAAKSLGRAPCRYAEQIIALPEKIMAILEDIASMTGELRHTDMHTAGFLYCWDNIRLILSMNYGSLEASWNLCAIQIRYGPSVSTYLLSILSSFFYLHLRTRKRNESNILTRKPNECKIHLHTTFFGYLRVTDIFRQAFAESPFSWPRSQPLPDDLSEDDRTVSSYKDLFPVD